MAQQQSAPFTLQLFPALLQPAFGTGYDAISPVKVPGNVIIDITQRINSDRPCVIPRNVTMALMNMAHPVCDDLKEMGDIIIAITSRVTVDEANNMCRFKAKILIGPQATVEASISIFNAGARYQ